MAVTLFGLVTEHESTTRRWLSRVFGSLLIVDLSETTIKETSIGIGLWN